MSRRRFLLTLVVAFALALAGSSQAAQKSGKTLFGTVGPGFTITLKNSNGKAVKSVPAGTYTFVITDKASIHDFHLFGKGVNKKTGVAFKGTTTWKGQKLIKGKTYKFRCDVHPTVMKGSFKAT
jgi:hypothetical protein